MSENKESDDLIIRCVRCTELEVPGTPTSRKRQCEDCGEDIWFDTQLLASAKKRYADKPIHLLCLACSAEVAAKEPIQMMPEQVNSMRARGLTDHQIAWAFAIGECIGGDFSKAPKVTAEIRDNPNGQTAAQFGKAFAQATLFVAFTSAPRSN